MKDLQELTGLLTTKEVAQELGYTLQHTTFLARTGKLPYAMKFEGKNGTYLFHVDTVHKFKELGGVK